jgi:hypothetical protein
LQPIVDVGAFFAIDLHTDVKIVHQTRGFLVLKAFMGHDMAPMAGGIADGHEQRFVAPLCFGQSFGPPGAPINGIVFMLQQIGAGFVGKQIGHGEAPKRAFALKKESSRFLALLLRFSQGERRRLRP